MTRSGNFWNAVNPYPRKARDENKIDPAVALIANLSLSLRLRFVEEKRSVYADPRAATR